MGRPPASPDSIKSAASAAARVYEVRLKRAAHPLELSITLAMTEVPPCSVSEWMWASKPW
ncbi:MAG: hypothetical protein ABC559_05820 [Candidatus Methanosuratincola petrocarbonis]